MFPEGTRSRTGGLGRGHAGTATLALHTGAPILPVAITGTENVKWPWFLLRPRLVRRVRVVLGEPFYLAEMEHVNREAARQATETIMHRIAEMLPLEYRGVYGSQEA